MIRVYYCRSDGIGSLAIRLFTWSRWNHVAIAIDGKVYNCTAQNGVHVITVGELYEQYRQIEEYRYDEVDTENAQAFLTAQVGKGYDFTAIVGIALRRNWEHPRRWFCSELTAKALMLAGMPVETGLYRITPQDLYRKSRTVWRRFTRF